MSKSLADDVSRAATITWQQALLAEGKTLPEPELDKSFLKTERGKAALSMLRQAGVNLKLPWAEPFWQLRRSLELAEPAAGRGKKKLRLVKKTPMANVYVEERAGKKRAGKKRAAKKARASSGKESPFIEELARVASTIVVVVATDARVAGKWTARGPRAITATMKKAYRQAHLLAGRGYATSLVVTDGRHVLRKQLFEPKK